MIAISADRFINLVILYLNSSAIHNLVNYKPQYDNRSTIYFNNLSTPDMIPKAVAKDKVFARSVLFPKCCPPGMSYKTEIRACAESTNATEIYQELNVTVDFIQSGLRSCTVIVDRFVKKDKLTRMNGNGSLVFKNLVYLSRNFCIDKIVDDEADENYVVRLCERKEYCTSDVGRDLKEWCLHKCCRDGLSLINGKCKLSHTTGIKMKDVTNIYAKADHYAVLLGNQLNCTKTYTSIRQYKFNVGTSEIMNVGVDSGTYKISEYCIDTRYESDVRRTRTVDYVRFCKPPSILSDIKDKVEDTAFAISFVCYILTVGIYIFVYKSRRLVEKLIVCCCIIDMIAGLRTLLRLFGLKLTSFCISLGYFTVFMRGSRLSWRNVLSFEIYRAIGTTIGRVNQTKDLHQKLMVYYTAYALLVPGVILLHVFLSREIYPLPDNAIPVIRKPKCNIYMIAGEYGNLHTYIPLAILAIANMALYAKTVHYFLKIKRDLKNMPHSDINKRKKKLNNKKGCLVLKLGLIMGLTWFHVLFNNINVPKNEVYRRITDISRIMHSLDGVYFFLIFGIKGKFLKAILYKLHILKKTDSNSVTADDTIHSNEISMDTVSVASR